MGASMSQGTSSSTMGGVDRAEDRPSTERVCCSNERLVYRNITPQIRQDDRMTEYQEETQNHPVQNRTDLGRSLT
jgi:hypothetical protein